MAEFEAIRRSGWAQESGSQQLVERALGGVRLKSSRGLQRASVVLQAEHGGGRDQLACVIAHPRQSDPDRVPDALRHGARPGLGQLCEHLLDKERVAGGARVHPRS